MRLIVTYGTGFQQYGAMTFKLKVTLVALIKKTTEYV